MTKRQTYTFKACLMLVALVSISLTGCTQNRARMDSKIRVNSIAPRQLPPEPVYSRLRWVALPEVHPLTEVSSDRLFGETRPRLLPVIHYTVDKTPVCEAALILASTARYTSYCSSLVSDRIVSLDQLGTIDELAQSLSQKAGAKLTVDHVNREVRVLSEVFGNTDPRFFEEGKSHEY